MYFVVLAPLIAFASSGGWGNAKVTGQTSIQCSPCPRGYHSTGCHNTCQKCPNGTFTNIPNQRRECIRCKSCHHDEEEISPCYPYSDVSCDCKDGYYYQDKKNRHCKKCSNANPSDNDDYKRKCLPCNTKECLNYPECKKKCETPPRPSDNIAIRPPNTTARTTATATATANTPSNNSSNPEMYPVSGTWNPMYWLILIAVFLMVVVVVHLGFPLVYIWKHPGKANRYLCWGTNTDIELHATDPKFNERCGDQCHNPATLTLNLFEETPMMSLGHSPATIQDPAHVSPLLPSTENEAARQDEQPEDWPAVILYAIIKEVPLRRWKEFLRLLSVADQQLERVELEAGFNMGSMERQYQMLRLWSQRPNASLKDVFSALYHMDLSGCAQLLQENLDRLQ